MLGLFLIMPVLAIYGQAYPDYTPLLVGVAIGAYGLTQALLQIPMGWLSDRVGRKPIILAGLSIFAVGSVVAAMADTLMGVTIGRVLQGAGAIAGAVLALAADSSRDEQRPKVMAIIGAGIGLSFVLALIIAPWLGGIAGISGLFWLTAALTGAAMLAVLFALPQPLQRVPSRDILPVPAEMKRLLSDGQLLRLNFGVFVLHLILTAWFVTLPLSLVDAGLAIEQHSWMYLPTLILSFAVMVPLMLYAIRTDRQIPGMRVAILFLVVALAAIMFAAGSLLVLVVSVWLFFIGFNYLEANLPAFLSQHAPAGSKGSASGIYTTCQFGGAFMGGVFGGILLQYASAQAVMIFCLVLLVCWLLFTFGMQTVSATTRVTVPLPVFSQEQARQLADQLVELAGVEEAVVVNEERAAYLKIQREHYKAESVQTLLAQLSR
ncbi:MAG: MFS transporter [Idiomarina sp.]|nr:MFS transporter [Idiomarina sp.]